MKFIDKIISQLFVLAGVAVPLVAMSEMHADSTAFGIVGSIAALVLVASTLKIFVFTGKENKEN